MKRNFKTLAPFPLVRKVLTDILLDSGAPSGRTVSATVMLYRCDWLEAVELAEKYLRKAKRLTKLSSAVSAEYFGTDARGREEAQHYPMTPFEVLSQPVNDSDIVQLRELGASPLEIFAIRQLLNEFFDGSLSDQWTHVTAGSPYAKMLEQRTKRVRK